MEYIKLKSTNTHNIKYVTISAKIPKIRNREVGAFNRGLEVGAEDKALDRFEDEAYKGESADNALKRSSFSKLFETKAFSLGYQVGQKYTKEWKQGRDLLNLAVKNKNIEPIGWELFQINPGKYVIEQT